jgi:hypothetical protein
MPAEIETASSLRKTWEKIGAIATIVALIGIINFFYPPDLPRYIRLGIAVALVITVLAVFRRFCSGLFTLLSNVLERMTPWLLLCIAVCSILSLFLLWPPSQPSGLVKFERGQSAVFNSTDHAKAHTRFITAFGVRKGNMDFVTEDGRLATFTYESNTNAVPTGLESSGGYLTFYQNARNRDELRALEFECRATETNGIPDIGVRLVVDNPKATGDKELAVLEIRSLRGLSAGAPLDSRWQKFSIDISDFEQIVLRPPFPPGLDANTINKLVFFVNTAIATNCPKATLWFKDVRFRYR